MRRASRFEVYSGVLRGFGGLALLALAAAILVWSWLQLDVRTLPGIRIAGEPLPRSEHPSDWLEQRARAWGTQIVQITTGVHLTRVSRAQLGAQLEVPPMAASAKRLGRSGNPVFDVWTAVETIGFGRDLRWVPRIDRLQVGRYVRAIRNAVERPPLAGARDHSGWSIAGVAGTTLDTVQLGSLVERALRAGDTRVSQALRKVPAPETLMIGSPDAVLYDDEAESEPVAHPPAGGPGWDPQQLLAAQPRGWLPSQGPECMDPPYERFCQGPRRVALPHGAAADLAERLGLGSVQTVGQLLHASPPAAWVQAAGGPTPRRIMVGWPAPQGRLWRRFGYVRKPPFENLLHRGIDVGAPRGSPVIAVNPGLVAYSDNGVRGYGNLLVIVHDDASVTFSAHCQAIYVFAGQRVQTGQIVGEVGETGMARGAHVHFEYRYQGEPIDPLRWFASL